jgi:hypothetical protein
MLQELGIMKPFGRGQINGYFLEVHVSLLICGFLHACHSAPAMLPASCAVVLSSEDNG